MTFGVSPVARFASDGHMNEILPGIHHWTVHGDEVGGRLARTYVDVEPAGALIDAACSCRGRAGIAARAAA